MEKWFANVHHCFTRPLFDLQQQLIVSRSTGFTVVSTLRQRLRPFESLLTRVGEQYWETCKVRKVFGHPRHIE